MSKFMVHSEHLFLTFNLRWQRIASLRSVTARAAVILEREPRRHGKRVGQHHPGQAPPAGEAVCQARARGPDRRPGPNRVRSQHQRIPGRERRHRTGPRRRAGELSCTEPHLKQTSGNSQSTRRLPLCVHPRVHPSRAAMHMLGCTPRAGVLHKCVGARLFNPAVSAGSSHPSPPTASFPHPVWGGDGRRSSRVMPNRWCSTWPTSRRTGTRRATASECVFLPLTACPLVTVLGGLLFITWGRGV